MLYLVPTPLGNLKDMTFRGIEVLQSVDVILCEDTRTSSKLLQHYQIQKPLSPYHQHNEHNVRKRGTTTREGTRTVGEVVMLTSPEWTKQLYIAGWNCFQK